MSDIIERLKNQIDVLPGDSPLLPILGEAVVEIERLRAVRPRKPVKKAKAEG